jgi:hypothetical protein
MYPIRFRTVRFLAIFLTAIVTIFCSCRKNAIDNTPVKTNSVNAEAAVQFLRSAASVSATIQNARENTTPIDIDYEHPANFVYPNGNIYVFNERYPLDVCERFRKVLVASVNDTIRGYIFETEHNYDSLIAFFYRQVVGVNPYDMNQMTGFVRIYSLDLQWQSTYKLSQGRVLSVENNTNCSSCLFVGGGGWEMPICSRYPWFCSGNGLGTDPVNPPLTSPCTGGGGSLPPSAGGGWLVNAAPGDRLCSQSFNFVGSAEYSFWHTNMYGLRFQNNVSANTFAAYYSLSNSITDQVMNMPISPSPMLDNLPPQTPLQYIADFFPNFFCKR